MQYPFTRCSALTGALIASLGATALAVQEARHDPGEACLAALAARPELAVLRGKFAFAEYRRQSLAMLANSDRPNAAEQTALSLWADAADSCLALGAAWRYSTLSPSSLALRNDFAQKRKALAADLYAGRLSYGEFAKAMASAEAALPSEPLRGESGALTTTPGATGSPVPPTAETLLPGAAPATLPLLQPSPTDCSFSADKGISCARR